MRTRRRRGSESGAAGRVPARRGPRGRRRRGLAPDAPRGEAREERVAVHAETTRGAALVPVLALERAQHVGLLEAVARLAERQRTRLVLAVGGAHLVHG